MSGQLWAFQRDERLTRQIILPHHVRIRKTENPSSIVLCFEKYQASDICTSTLDNIKNAQQTQWSSVINKDTQGKMYVSLLSMNQAL